MILFKLAKQIYWPKVVLLQLIALLFFLNLQSVSGQQAVAISKVSITVSNLNKALFFYTEVLPFKETKRYSLSGPAIQRLFGIQDTTLAIEIVELQLGNERIELMEFSTGQLARPIPFDSKSNDLWFQHIAIVVSDMEQAYQRLRQHKVTHVSTAPQILPDYIPAAAGIAAFYFRDQDGHNLELIYFPEGKGNPKWQKSGTSLFQGIDHTAIGIEETEEALDFYKDILGLKVAGNSENYGSEQEHLNQVFGARLLITGLQARAGIGLEFLDYIAPPGGRAYPVDSQATDLWHWQTSIQVKDAEAVFERVQKGNFSLISNGLIDLSDTSLNLQKGFLVRGPDGHALFIYE